MGKDASLSKQYKNNWARMIETKSWSYTYSRQQNQVPSITTLK